MSHQGVVKVCVRQSRKTPRHWTSFFGTLECELIDRRTFRTHAEARMAIFDFIESFYNPRRRHSALEYLSPVGYEEKHRSAA